MWWRERLSVTNLSSENNFADVDVSTECSSHHQGESEEVQTEDTRHWRSKVGEDSFSLPASSSQQSSNQG